MTSVFQSVCGNVWQADLRGQGSFRAGTHRNAVPVLFRHIAAKFRFHFNESDKFALFGSKMPSASGGLRPPDPLTRGSAPGPR